MDTLLKNVQQTIQDFHMVDSGQTILLAVSGGADSVAMLHAFAMLRDRLPMQLMVAHLNHGMRPDADEDALFVETMVRRMGIPCACEAVDVPAYQRQHRLSPEDAARRLRYAYLRAVATQWRADHIAVAHTADDQAETVVMQLLRGAGLRGLAGIPPKRGTIIRPLIRVQRRDIVAFLQKYHIAFRDDPSNQQRHYLRNRLRLDLMPHLRGQYNPRLTETLSTTALLLAEDEATLQSLARQHLETARLPGQSAQIALRIDRLTPLPAGLQRRILRQALSEVNDQLDDIGAKHIAAILHLLRTDAGSRRVILPHQLLVERRYDILLMQRHSPSLSVVIDEPLPIPGRCEMHALGFTVLSDFLPVPVAEPLPQGDEAWFDATAVGLEMHLRTRRNGDRFQPLGSPHTKKLKDFLIAAKMPRAERDRLPLVVTPHGIAWVVGMRMAEWAKVNPATHKILRLRVIRHPSTDAGKSGCAED